MDFVPNWLYTTIDYICELATSHHGPIQAVAQRGDAGKHLLHGLVEGRHGVVPALPQQDALRTCKPSQAVHRVIIRWQSVKLRLSHSRTHYTRQAKPVSSQERGEVATMDDIRELASTLNELAPSFMASSS